MKSTMDHPAHALRRANHSDVVTSVAFAPDGEVLASGSWDGTIKLWDLRGGRLRLRRTLRGEWDEVEAIAFAPGGGAIAGLGAGWDGGPFGVVTIWDRGAARGRALARVDDKLDAIAFAPDGETLATAGADGHAVTLWDVATGRARRTLPDHRGPVWSVAYSPDGTMLAAASGVVPTLARPDGPAQVGAVRLWDLRGPEPVPHADFEGHEFGAASVAFSPDGLQLASGGFDRAVTLWDVAARREWATLAGHEGWVAAVAFSPDGSTLATGSHDHGIKLWDAATGRELATLAGHTGNVYSVAFSPDGRLLASGSLDGSVRLWDVARMPGWKMGA